MTISTTIAALAARLLLANPSPQPQLRRVYQTPAEAVSIGEFPSALLALAPAETHDLREQAMGAWHHHYTIQCIIFLGSHQAGSLAENMTRAMAWPLALATVLVADLRLGGAVVTMGPNDLDQPLFTYRVGPFVWGSEQYYTLRLSIPMTEAHILTTG